MTIHILRNFQVGGNILDLKIILRLFLSTLLPPSDYRSLPLMLGNILQQLLLKDVAAYVIISNLFRVVFV